MRWLKISVAVVLGLLPPLTAPAPAVTTQFTAPLPTIEKTTFAYDGGYMRVDSDNVFTGSEASEQFASSLGQLVGLVAAKSETAVIGRVKDLQNLGPGEKVLVGSPAGPRAIGPFTIHFTGASGTFWASNYKLCVNDAMDPRQRFGARCICAEG